VHLIISFDKNNNIRHNKCYVTVRLASSVNFFVNCQYYIMLFIISHCSYYFFVILCIFVLLKVIRELLDEFDIDTDIWETSLNERLWHVSNLLFLLSF